MRLGILLYPPVFTSLSRDINYFSYLSTSLVYITIHKNKIKTKITGDKIIIIIIITTTYTSRTIAQKKKKKLKLNNSQQNKFLAPSQLGEVRR